MPPYSWATSPTHTHTQTRAWRIFLAAVFRQYEIVGFVALRLCCNWLVINLQQVLLPFFSPNNRRNMYTHSGLNLLYAKWLASNSIATLYNAIIIIIVEPIIPNLLWRLCLVTWRYCHFPSYFCSYNLHCMARLGESKTSVRGVLLLAVRCLLMNRLSWARIRCAEAIQTGWIALKHELIANASIFTKSFSPSFEKKTFFCFSWKIA